MMRATVWVCAALGMLGACVLERDSGDDCGPMPWSFPPPNVLPAGLDSSTLSAAYDTSFSGTVRWRSGETAHVEFATHFESAGPAHDTIWCGKNHSIQRVVPASLTGDGGLDARAELLLNAGFRGVGETSAMESLSWMPPRVVPSAQGTLGTIGDEL